MTLDPNILREAEQVLALYSRPAQEAIKENLFGVREARFAGAILKKAFTVVSYQEPTETEIFKSMRHSAAEQIVELRDVLRKAMTVIEERVAGEESLLAECEEQIAAADEDWTYYADDPDVPEDEGMQPADEPTDEGTKPNE